MNKERFYNFEISTTDLCNMKCDYCFEPPTSKSNNLNKKLPQVIEKVNELLNSKWIKNNFVGLNIGFWGGEPTLNSRFIKDILDYYKNTKNVVFYIYTNGYKIKRTIDILKKFSKFKTISHNVPKIKVQMSYDGKPIHDLSRKSLDGKPTSEEVLKNSDILYNMGVDIKFKSTLIPSHFKYLPEVWDDFYNLYVKFGRSRSFKYSPTIDIKNIYEDNCFEDFRASIIKIAKREVDFHRSEQKFLFSWVDGEKVHCKPGVNLSSMDTKGDIYFCHGCFYAEDKAKTKIGSIFDLDIVKKIKESNVFLGKYTPDIKECEICEATMCIRCNVQKFERSEKNGFINKWFDYPSQPEHCEYFKFFGKVNRAIRKIIFMEV
jgi:uncharacterized protein